MSYGKPPTGVFFSANTNAVANTDTTHTLIAAPGAGIAIRVSLIHLSYSPAVTGIIQVRSNVAGNLQHSLNVGPNGPSAQFIIPEPGYLLAANQALTTISRSNVATQNFTVIVYYYLDNLG